MGCFSLTASKTITTGQGGIIVTNNSKLNKKIRLLKNQGIEGRSDGGNVKHSCVGFNFKYTNLQAAMGLAQIETIKIRAKKLIKINKLYSKKLNNVQEVSVLKFKFDKGEVPLWTDLIAKKNRDNLIEYLKKNHVECRKFWYPLHQQKPFKTSDKYFTTSSSISKKLFWLPSSINLTEKKINYICDLIKKFYKRDE